MERRDFFRAGVKRAAEAGAKAAAESANRRARRWVRPPYALEEFDFLLACTRCDKCVDACPYDVIFPLSADLGLDVASTPALDVLNKACRLCAEWPCVNACDDGALIRADADAEGTTALPIMAVVTIDTSTCLPYQGPECGACAPACPVQGALVWQNEKPTISADHCTGCGLCREACIVEPKAINIRSIHSFDPAKQHSAID